MKIKLRESKANKKIRSNIKQQAGPKDIEEYNRIMTKGSKYSPKFFKDK